MGKTEYYFRLFVTWIARHVPVETPGWCVVGMALPIIVSWVFVRGTITHAWRLNIVRAMFSYKFLWWTEVAIHVVAGFVVFSFFCRLLQISEPKYFDNYKTDEQF